MENDALETFGINIGALKTVYSKCFKPDNKFQTKVLLSDDSSRVFPSIICYSKDHRLIGETAKSLYKKFINTSYIYISRYIDYQHSGNSFFNEEIKYMLFGTLENGKLKDYSREDLFPSEIIADYLSMINKFYNEQNIIINNCVISVPDFFLEYQRNLLKNICNAIGIENIKVINESTAITMYYGYTKYKDMFVTEKINVNSGIKKDIIFIDIGHSKTSFIYSTFNYDKFKVKNVKCIPFLGGRNFNIKIKDECIKYFLNKYNYKLEDINKKSIARLFEVIEKERIKLTVNKEIIILVESFHDNEDLEYHLTKENFEKIIKEEIDIFQNKFKEFKNELIEINNGIIPEDLNIEIAGDLFRTPILQDKIIECFDNKIQISKTVIVDECTSVGAALMAYYLYNKNFPISTFKKIEGYQMYQRIAFSSLERENLKEEIVNEIKYFMIPKSLLMEKKKQLIVFPYAKNKDMEKYFNNITNYTLELDVKKISSKYKNQVLYIGMPIIENWNSNYFLAIKKNNIFEKVDIPEDWITQYVTSEEKQQYKYLTNKKITQINEGKSDFDKKYHDYANKKNKLTKKFFAYKNKAKTLDNKEINNKIRSLENELKQIDTNNSIDDKIKNLDEFEKNLNIPELDN